MAGRWYGVRQKPQLDTASERLGEGKMGAANRAAREESGPQAAQHGQETMSDGVACVCQELVDRANAGATLPELDGLLQGHVNNPGLTADEYEELWLYAWALVHRPGGRGRDDVGTGLELAAPKVAPG